MKQFQHDIAINFFNNVKPGDFVTRKMYIEAMKLEGIRETSADNLRLQIQRAGYLYDPHERIKKPGYVNKHPKFPLGIYYKLKDIPKMSSTQLHTEAYPPKPIKKNVTNTTCYGLKMYAIGPELQDIVGMKQGYITKIVTNLWNYVKKHDLQNPKNKRNIICKNDPQLKAIMGGRNEISMLEMMPFVRKHLREIK